MKNLTILIVSSFLINFAFAESAYMRIKNNRSQKIQKEQERLNAKGIFELPTLKLKNPNKNEYISGRVSCELDHNVVCQLISPEYTYASESECETISVSKFSKFLKSSLRSIGAVVTYPVFAVSRQDHGICEDFLLADGYQCTRDGSEMAHKKLRVPVITHIAPDSVLITKRISEQTPLEVIKTIKCN